MRVTDYLKNNEGFRSRLYYCSEGKRTIGYGWNIDAGISQSLADVVLVYQLQRIRDFLQSYRFWSALPEARQTVLTDMCFQLGKTGFSEFKKMLAALYAHDYDSAANEIVNSHYARQTPPRARMNANIMRSGAFPQ